MKICLIGGIYSKGGARSNYVKITPETTLENGFREAGHEVTTLSHYDEADFGQFDVVHVHHLSYGALRLVGDPSTTPFVFTPHSTAHIAGGRMSPARRLAMRYVLSGADALVSLSQAEQSGACENFRLRGTALAAIPNGIDVSKYNFRRSNRAGQGGPWQLLFVGQLIGLKRCDLLLRAVAATKHEVELTLIYQNPQCKQELMALAASLGITHRVHFHGEAGPEQLADFYQRSDVFVLPSDTEALPSVITEAMLCGLPFVASAVGGIPEQANGYGILLEQRTVETLASAIAQVIEDYGRFQADGPAMSEHARNTFAIRTMVARHLELYGSLRGIAPRRRSPQFRIQRGVAHIAAKWFGTSGPVRPAQSAITEVA